MLKLEPVRIEKPADVNVIVGQAHFIKTVEDLHEALAGSVPGAKFGIAFCEASGMRLIRHSGTEPQLEELAVRHAQAIGAGHVFVVTLGNVFPIHVLRAVREVPEICRIFCATANDVQVLVAESELGRGVVGVIDGEVPVGVEGPNERAERIGFLRNIGLKLG